MTDIDKAINAQLEIIRLSKKIDSLRAIVRANNTLVQQAKPQFVEVDADKIG